MKNDFKKISVIIPAYNKGPHLKQCLKLLTKELERLPYNYEVIIVNDGSQDNTLKKALEYVNSSRQQHFRIISYPLNVGKGFAICYGSTKATGDPVIFFDADLDIHPRQIHLLIEYLVHHDADIVVGSRRHPDSQTNYPLSRRIMSQTYQYLTRLLFQLNIRDTQLGLKVFRKKVLDEIIPKLTIKKWTFDVELLVAAHQNGFTKIIEAPIVLTHQPIGSTVGLSAIFNSLKDTAAIFYRDKICKHYTKNQLPRNQLAQTESLTVVKAD
ncbi:glycosyltransferase [Patescibacteria group bacterium]|nr:glycosyltransferase [Patescibacteria group bacterium]MBU1868147.1 glycosyltransferase [Patescibacteria group bacterium]